jgi:tetratricopeptide (TPR) repeat protein
MPPPSLHQRPSGNVAEAIHRAFARHQAGNLNKAEVAFKEVLSRDASQFDALHMLAVIDAQRGPYSEGIRLLSEALVVNPDSAEANINLARMRAERHDYVAAIESCRRAIPQSGAAAFAQDPSLLDTVRGIESSRHGPLFDTAQFTHRIEATYTQTWNRLQKGERPMRFTVELEP